MSPTCAIVRGQLSGYRRDALAGPERRVVRQHLTDCAACRGVAAGQDPTLLFARISGVELPAAETEGILAAVRTGVALMEAERRIERKPAARRRLAGAAAAAVVGALLLLNRGESTARSAPAVSAATSEIANAPAPSLSPSPETGLQPVAFPAQAEAPASNATVYEWNPGAGRDEPRVVWIVDRELDI